MPLLPIEWVEKVPKFSPPRGGVPYLAGHNEWQKTRLFFPPGHKPGLFLPTENPGKHGRYRPSQT
jgi:hypothetical protein